MSEEPAVAGERSRMAFDEVAEVYDRARPRYPDGLVEDLVRTAALVPGRGRILEIGPGTGQLTVPLARRGYEVTAVELGPALAAVARRNLAPFPRVRVDVEAFERWPLPPEPFDAVVFATCFHWFDPDEAVAKAARALREGGTLTVVTTRHVAGGTAGFFERAQGCYERWDPATPPDLRLPEEDEIPSGTAALDRCPRFGPVRVARHIQEIGYSTSEYLEALSTYSNHRALAPEALRGLTGCLGELIDDSYGGRITKRHLHELITAQRVA